MSKMEEMEGQRSFSQELMKMRLVTFLKIGETIHSRPKPNMGLEMHGVSMDTKNSKTQEGTHSRRQRESLKTKLSKVQALTSTK